MGIFRPRACRCCPLPMVVEQLHTTELELNGPGEQGLSSTAPAPAFVAQWVVQFDQLAAAITQLRCWWSGFAFKATNVGDGVVAVWIDGGLVVAQPVIGGAPEIEFAMVSAIIARPAPGPHVVSMVIQSDGFEATSLRAAKITFTDPAGNA